MAVNSILNGLPTLWRTGSVGFTRNGSV